jgi:DNA-binding protein HU-beta/integration host factor subunit beta
VESFLESISKALSKGRKIEIRGFGRFKVKQKKARVARNPHTGDVVQVKAGVKPVFEASKELKVKLNDILMGSQPPPQPNQ